VSTVEEVGMRRRSPGVDDEAVPRRARTRAAPQRSCVVCRATTAKRDLHRIVRAPAGTVAYDPTGKAAGRGAYLCGRPDCLETAVRRRSIQRALKLTDAEAATAAVEALRNRMMDVWSGSADRPAPRSSDDEEVRPG
jgi:uncharacterized protein